ncbi:MAG: hypothetical protein HOM90_06135 [Porticoccaceae bacterium]|nr:hypothetical protein [Porticoccaceae bacterium]MBT6422855.1 hypothetical protein [Porticoccaceae bacterium]MBT7566184.1 hypothetical protein [Porticoccaceae bacterium]MBT7964292.1 hypothetical protein [Porticoccaceae bacterium]
MTAELIKPRPNPLDIRQIVKIVVYSLLLVNFMLYIRDDWVIAGHILRSESSLLELTRAFATTIDESAWMFLLILFELETYILSDDALSRTKTLLMQGVRVICYVSLSHTIYAYVINLVEIYGAVPLEGVTSLCQIIDRDVSYASNLVYTKVSEINCAALSGATQFFYVDPPTHFIVEDYVGLVIEKQLGWVDLIEGTTWLLILFTIEVTVWLQDRNISQGMVFKLLTGIKIFLYTLLWGAIGYWIYRAHYMFAWDEFVWIAGFMAIEMNVVDWRNEIRVSEKESKQGFTSS